MCRNPSAVLNDLQLSVKSLAGKERTPPTTPLSRSPSSISDFTGLTMEGVESCRSSLWRCIEAMLGAAVTHSADVDGARDCLANAFAQEAKQHFGVAKALLDVCGFKDKAFNQFDSAAVLLGWMPHLKALYDSWKDVKKKGRTFLAGLSAQDQILPLNLEELFEGGPRSLFICSSW